MSIPFRFSISLLAVGLLALSQCKKATDDLPYKYQSGLPGLPETMYSYQQQDLPAHLGSVIWKLTDQVTDGGATLGRVLFYDPALSLTNNIACASCHHQENGFADPVVFSRGFDGGLTKRNANSIVNPIAADLFFWDAREDDLKRMVLQPVKNHVEMGMDNFDALEKKLAALPYYAPLFKAAFGDETITRDRIAEGLSQFLKSMVTAHSKFDLAGPHGWGGFDDESAFNGQELQGANLFFGTAGCANCHNLVVTPGPNFADIGLDAVYEDKGLGTIHPGLDGMFKIPSLRNVALTAPYMHDGRFATLMDVVNHYSDNVQFTPNLDWRMLENGAAKHLNLNQADKEALVAFLQTLTDQQFVNDPKFSDPFK